MFVPNAWQPSGANSVRVFDQEGRLHETRAGETSIGEANSLYATESEFFDSISPFLRRNKARDAKRRNYVIQPGGACLYRNEELLPRFAELPRDQDSLGHDSNPGGLSVGVVSGRSSGR